MAVESGNLRRDLMSKESVYIRIEKEIDSYRQYCIC